MKTYVAVAGDLEEAPDCSTCPELPGIPVVQVKVLKLGEVDEEEGDALLQVLGD